MTGGYIEQSLYRNAPIIPIYFSSDTKKNCCLALRIQNIDFEVYCAKKSDNRVWNSEELMRGVAQTRKSYERYGDVALFDHHDERAAVYLVKARYNRCAGQSSDMCEEMISMRFVPGNRNGAVPEDFELFHVAGKPLITYLNDTGYDHQVILDEVVSLSRFCATEPVVVGSHGQKSVLGAKTKRRATVFSFMLMNACFFAEAPHTISYVSGIMRTELKTSLVRGSRVGDMWLRAFPLADDFLSCNPCDVSLSYDADVVYRYPGYFLHATDIQRLIIELIETDRLSCSTISAICLIPCSLAALKNDFALFLAHLGSLLMYKGDLPYAAISAEHLRALVRERVQEGPRLYLGYRDLWERLISTSLNAAVRRTDTRVDLYHRFPFFPFGYASAFAR